jgi:DME family drug/metabolite transporter
MSKGKYSAAIIAAGSLWGFMGLFRRYMGGAGVQTAGIIFLRCGIAALLFLATILLRDPKMLKIRLRDLWCFIGTGLMSLVFFSVCYYSAMTVMSLSAAAILLYTAPGIVVLISALLFGEKLTWRKITALLMAFGGCCLVCGIGSSDTHISAVGILYGLGSGFGYALYSIFGKLAMERGYGSLTINFYTSVLAAACSAAVWGAGEPVTVMFASGYNLALCITAGVVTCYLPYMLYTYGLSGLEAGKASIMASVEPVVATFVGMIFFNERLTAMSAVGVALVLTAVAMLNVGAGDKSSRADTAQQ